MTVLSNRRLKAIIEALNFRLAGAIEDDTLLRREDYEAARAWAIERETIRRGK